MGSDPIQFKSLIAAFVSADQLWEQWLADPNNKINELKWYNPAKSLLWISEITRSVAKWSLQYNINPLIAKDFHVFHSLLMRIAHY